MGMTLRTSDQQTEALRKQAAAEGRSMQAVALSAIDEYIARRTHRAKVAAALLQSLGAQRRASGWKQATGVDRLSDLPRYQRALD